MGGYVNDGDLERVRATKRKFGSGYGRCTEGIVKIENERARKISRVKTEISEDLEVRGEPEGEERR